MLVIDPAVCDNEQVLALGASKVLASMNTRVAKPLDSNFSLCLLKLMMA